ncbi:hypothetical protein SMSP2_00879 [Limihaloglobus sulfuriphilus]|uniref:Uncharacterized protein n=1 Tax=Limihaloglobus sulfuriphilus TaxID=1851148 RepID=A0A1Q2MDZ0_9BACT|nr:hypothetical protein SMSP2_00879 [Limihaloglobus sulfuriphilus]
MQIDIGFGDSVNPPASMVQYPAILDMPAPDFRAYRPETVIAEKVEAMVVWGLPTAA